MFLLLVIGCLVRILRMVRLLLLRMVVLGCMCRRMILCLMMWLWMR